MADTRCANPAYQLEVDEMVLDYLIYQCIKTQLDEYKSRDSHRNRHDASAMLREPSARLLQILDTSLQLFKLNHLDKSFPDNMSFNIRLLEFITMLIHRQAALAPTTETTDPISLKQFYKEQGYSLDRRCAHEIVHGQFLKDQDKALNDNVSEMWSDLDPHITDVGPIDSILPLILLTPLFLEISAETVNFLDQEPNEMWMELAGQFMLRSALESLTPKGFTIVMQCIKSAQGNQVGDDRGVDSNVTRAFSWGYIKAEQMQQFTNWKSDNQAGEDVGGESEQLVNSMFQDWRTREELESWAAVRRRYKSYFNCKHKNDRSATLQQLDERFPLCELEKSVMAYMEGIWRLVGSGSDDNKLKPVLVQIEEGHLHGLNDEEFRDFMKIIGANEHVESLANIILPPRNSNPRKGKTSEL